MAPDGLLDFKGFQRCYWGFLVIFRSTPGMMFRVMGIFGSMSEYFRRFSQFQKRYKGFQGLYRSFRGLHHRLQIKGLPGKPKKVSEEYVSRRSMRF